MKLLRRQMSSDYILNFFTSSVVTILFWRAYLSFFDYPRIQFGNLHIAHVLFGGIIMFVVIMLNLLYVGTAPAILSSILGGFGFGLFIDELGKFMTKDNNYFYQPTVVIIYLIFVLFFFFLRYVRNHEVYSIKEQKLHRALEKTEGKFSSVYLVLIQRKLRARYRILSEKRLFQRAILLSLVVYMGFMLERSFRIGYSLIITKIDQFPHQDLLRFSTENNRIIFSLAAQFASHAVAGLCVFIGTIYIKSSRKIAYDWYIRGALIWIFVTQVFLFYNDQFFAVIYLVISLLVYGALRYMREEELEKVQCKDREKQ